MNLRHIAAFVIACSVVGCSKKEPEVPPEVSEFMKNIEESAAYVEKQKSDEAALLESLKSNPTPIFERAEKSIRDNVARTAGDDSASKATITVDKSSLKTFGPEKWTVRGQLQADDKDGNPRDTTWEATLEVMFGSLQVRSTRLDIKN